MNVRNICIVLVVILFIGGGYWHYQRTPSPTVVVPVGESGGVGAFQLSTSTPHVTPPTTPPPGVASTTPDVSVSGIRGSVTIGPTCPVERIPPDPQCADRPYAANLAIMDDKGNLVKTVWSDKNGIFEVIVPAGKYSIGPSPASSILPRASFQDVVVKNGSFITITIEFDSGIR